MNLTLALPSLNRRGDETPPPLSLPAFNQILRYGRRRIQPQRPSEFYSRYLWRGSLLQQAKRALGTHESAAVALASPLWQQMGMHQVSILGGEHLAITAEEAQRFCRELSDFYRQDGWQFRPLRNDLWLVLLPETPDWNVLPADDICGQIGANAQADGADALQWLNKQTEIQMWLHSHPLNLFRQAKGLAAVNGLWLWQDLCGGQTHRLLATDSSRGQFFDGTRIAAPESFTDYLQQAAAQPELFSDGLILLDELTATDHTGDIWAYQTILERWETLWFQPLWQALKTGRLQRLTIATDGEQGGELVIGSKPQRAFWKRAKTFAGIW